jgi:neural Wiskott-Aldrich syndrome protein
LRVLQAAASAAQQSKRRQIDGAIVLAAIVGDGKSPAAGLLKALGMTFEEAIRALQRANTKARLKPLPKAASATAAADAQAAAPAPAESAPEPAPQPRSLSAEIAALAPEGESAQTSAPQSADDILAAARARIQQRSGGSARPEVPLFEDGASGPAPEPVQELTDRIEALTRKPQRAPPEAEPMSDAMRDLLAVSEAGKAARKPPASEPMPVEAMAAALPQSRSSWTPPPEPRGTPPASRLPPPPAVRGPAIPFGGRGAQAGEAPQRATMPGGRGAPPASGGAYPNRPSRAPWPESTPPMPPGANGSYPPLPHLPHDGRGMKPAAAPLPTFPPPAPQRSGGSAERGPLVENVPRRMRTLVPAGAEVRIARDKLDGLIQALINRSGGHRPEPVVAQALSVRLRAPAGGFWIEPTSPETQWLESGAQALHNEAITWRWAVTPQQRGRGRLVLMVSMRTIGLDGSAAESAPPDRVIDVKVAARHGRRLLRMLGWLVVLGLGAMLGRFGGELWAPASLLLKKALG